MTLRMIPFHHTSALKGFSILLHLVVDFFSVQISRALVEPYRGPMETVSVWQSFVFSCLWDVKGPTWLPGVVT